MTAPTKIAQKREITVSLKEMPKRRNLMHPAPAPVSYYGSRRDSRS
jgi:hypothetical protein